MYKISGEVIKFIENTMENWRVELTVGEKKTNQSENPRRDLPRRRAITMTICYNDDAI